ncbi:MAG: histone deacetylase family protein [Alphaproteobacteria bacterium]
MTKTAIYTHADCFLHNPGEGHPESPTRLKDILDLLQKTYPKEGGAVEWKEAQLGTDAQVLYCHDAEYLARVKKIVGGLDAKSAPANTDVDTRVSEGSLRAAMRGVGAACQAVDDVYNGKVRRAFCAVRPPGHHALTSTSMGFCLFGNVAIAAFHALQKPDVKRVAIIDFDVHHGNGTQELVEKDPRILFFSTHQKPLWPYQPDSEPEVRGASGNIRNFPVPERADTSVHYDIWKKHIIPEIEAFKPDFIFLSAGFDAHRDDPPKENLFNDPPGRQMLVEKDFDWMTQQLLATAEKCCKGRFVSVLEGGYNTKVLASCCVSHVKTLAEAA